MEAHRCLNVSLWKLGRKYEVRVRKGGLVCRNVRIHAPDAVMVGTSTSYTLQYIISSKVEKLYHLQ